MALCLSGATSEDRETGERYAPNPHFETLHEPSMEEPEWRALEEPPLAATSDSGP
jgi:hypothetical protein